jgi:hypothetical protein
MREKARELRRTRELTIDEIAERLAVSRTTVFFWVGDMPRPERCVENAKPPPYRLGNDAMKAKYRQLREMAYREGMDSFDRLQERSGFLEFVTLFIAEGYKRSRNVVSIANSDPAIVVFSAGWMRELSRNRLTYSVQYHADQDLKALRRFWGDQLGVGPTHIRLQRKSNSNQLKARTWRSKHGVLTVATNDTYFRARLQAWVDCLRQRWLDSPAVGA